jgi:hypothetical protein
MSYLENAKSDAQDTAENFRDEIVEKFLEGEVSNDLLNDYPNGDEWHNTNHTDKAYDLLEAATLLDELDDYEETDSGLWAGQKPRDAISSQAAYTYANAVYGQWRDLVEVINDDLELDLLRDAIDEVDNEVADELTEHRDDAEANDSCNDEDENFDEEKYFAPFDEDDKIERRKKELTVKIEARIDALIAAFTD